MNAVLFALPAVVGLMAPRDTADDFFGATRLHEITVTVTAENWKAMQPDDFGGPGGFPGGPGGGGPGGFPGGGQGRPGGFGGGQGGPGGPGGFPPSDSALVQSPDGSAAQGFPGQGGQGFPGGQGGPGGFGGFPGQGGNQQGRPGGQGRQGGPGGPGPMERDYPQVRATITVDGGKPMEISLRFKGNSSYQMSSRGYKRPFKIDLDQYVAGQSVGGQTKLSLSNNASDSTQLRETLAYTMFQKMDVPASRTAFARLTLNVKGERENIVLGLYTLAEQVDSAFLKSRFGTGDGLLLKPEGARNFQAFGDDWKRYDAMYVSKGKPSDADKKRFIEFVKLVNNPDDTAFAQKVGSYLDIDEFARFLAGNAAASNLDSILSMGHNFYMWLDPRSHKFVFIPWDLNMAFGGFPGGGADAVNLSVKHPHAGDNRLIDRFLALPEGKAAYEKAMRRAATILQTLPALYDDADTVTRSVRAAEAESGNGNGPGGFPGGGPGGFGGPGGGGPGGGGPGGGGPGGFPGGGPGGQGGFGGPGGGQGGFPGGPGGGGPGGFPGGGPGGGQGGFPGGPGGFQGGQGGPGGFPGGPGGQGGFPGGGGPGGQGFPGGGQGGPGGQGFPGGQNGRRGMGGPGGMGGRVVDLKSFFTRRALSIVSQLDGRSEGDVPRGMGGPGGPGPGGPGPGGPGPGGPGQGGPGGFNPQAMLGSLLLNAAGAGEKPTVAQFGAAWKARAAAWDTDHNGRLDGAELSAGFSGGAGGFGGGPDGFGGPGPMMGGAILQRMGATSASPTVAVSSFAATLAAWGKTWDSNNDGVLDSTETGQGLMRLLPMQGPGGPGQGGPGGGFPGGPGGPGGFPGGN